ncbi:C1 family peptidase [Methanobacterium paludis]|uniref:hypothetical protein n=1 Tax=Methanobacterium paludis (strain DSM 25820 / JCM 18151 / SWAN1) TaxID=868131 RepID=UPI00064E9516|nr:hypothetical protein [Methanobacterium paludis]
MPFEKDERDLKLAAYIDKTVLPTPPDSTNDYEAFTDWGMFLNDKIGDCAIAGPLHMLMLWLTQGGKTPEFTDANALEAYSAISGYDPKTGENDNGCMLRDVLKYWKNTGIPDKNGVRHKIGAFVQLDQADHEEIKIAQYLFSALNIGFLVPAYAMEQFEKGEPWDVQTKNASIEGGHCVIDAGYGKLTSKKRLEAVVRIVKITKEGIWVITWGKKQFMTWKFWDKYVDEAWCVLSEEFLVNGKSPDGFDLKQLQADLKALD